MGNLMFTCVYSVRTPFLPQLIIYVGHCFVVWCYSKFTRCLPCCIKLIILKVLPLNNEPDKLHFSVDISLHDKHFKLNLYFKTIVSSLIK
jgi:hypothetical protein